jgi:hypothetical protein
MAAELENLTIFRNFSLAGLWQNYDIALKNLIDSAMWHKKSSQYLGKRISARKW